MNKILTISYEKFEEGITVLSVIDTEKDEVLKMFNGEEAENILKLLTEL